MLAQSGRGMTWRDKPGDPNGGNCYNCHQLRPAELAFGTIGPSLLQYGKMRGNTPETQKYTYGKIYNAKAYNLCSNMPRFGNVHFLHFTDCHAQLLPIYFREPSVNLGVGEARGERQKHEQGEQSECGPTGVQLRHRPLSFSGKLSRRGGRPAAVHAGRCYWSEGAATSTS